MEAAPKRTGVWTPVEDPLGVELRARRVEQVELLERARVVGVARRVQRVERARVDGGRAAEDALQGQEALLRAVHDALEVAVAADGPGERHGLQAELGLDVVQDPERLDARAVGLVGEGDDRQPADLAGREELAGALLDAAGGVQDHDHAVDGRQGAEGVLGEVLVARGVDEVQDEPVVLQAQGRGGHGDPAALLELHEVRRGVRAVALGADAAGLLHGARVHEQLLGERRLARRRDGR
jgi:hypothetical protein